MSQVITVDDLDARMYEAAAATSRTQSSLKRNVTIWSIAADLWSVSRKAGSLIQVLNDADFDCLPGVSRQHIEKRLGSLVIKIDEALVKCTQMGLVNRTLTGGAVHSISAKSGELKDFWVMLNASTDPDLDNALKTAKTEDSIDWESAWQ